MSYDPIDDQPEDNSALRAALEPYDECDHDYSFGICNDCGDTTEDYDGAPLTREEVTAGYVNPSHERLAAWQQKLELTR